MPSRIVLVAFHVFKENVRDRVLYTLAAFAVLMVGASVLIGQITAGQDVKIIKDLGLAAIELAGLLMAVFVGVGLVAREIDRRSIYGILAKPLHRWEFIAGKYVGLVLTIAGNVVLMTAAFYVVLAWMDWATPVNVKNAWEAPALDPAILLAMTLIVAELALVTAVALFFSTFSSSALLSVVFTLGVFVAGSFAADFTGLATVVESPATAGVLRLLGAALPSFASFDVKAQVVHGHPVPPGFVAMTLLYGAVYAAILVGAAAAVFSRREFR